MIQATAFLLFDGNCAQAMTFYHACLGGELSLTPLKDTPMKDLFASEKHDRIINAHIANGQIELSAADWMASPDFDPVRGNMSAIFLFTPSHREIQTVFDKLAQGADRARFQDLHEMPFGLYGQFYDRFGVQWIFKSDLPSVHNSR